MHPIHFDYKNKDLYMKALNEFIALMQDIKFDICLHGGTLLGAVRGNDFIKTDDDIDIFYIAHKNNLSDVLNEFKITIQPFLEKNGYTVEPINWMVHNNSAIMFGQYHITKNNITLDLWASWITEDAKFYLSPCIVGELTKPDIFPLTKILLNNEKFNVPNKYKKLLINLYGEGWQIPSDFKPKPKSYFLQKTILKLIDAYGWAYHFIAQDQQKYSIHNIRYVRIEDFKNEMLYDIDILYFPSPGLSAMQVEKINNHAKKENKDLKIIGAYAGEYPGLYGKDTDLIVSISAKYTQKLKQLYPDKPVIFLPEGIDAEYFAPNNKKLNKSFTPGFAGRKSKVKRIHILDALNYPIKKQTEHGKEFFTEDRSRTPMLKFYHSLDCLVLSSISECMPRVVLEAMACALPIVCTDVGSIRMLLDEEWIVPVLPEEITIAEINNRFHLLSKYPELRQKIGKRNREHILKYFDWTKIQPLWDEVFCLLNAEDFVDIIKVTNNFNKQFYNAEPTLNTSILSEKVEEIKKPNVPSMEKKIVMYSATPLQGLLWKFYQELKSLNVEIDLIQDKPNYNTNAQFSYQYLWDKDRSVCMELLEKADIVIFVQYYNDEIMKIAKNKIKIAVCCGDFPCTNHDGLLTQCQYKFTTKPDIYKNMIEIKTIKDILWKI